MLSDSAVVGWCVMFFVAVWGLTLVLGVLTILTGTKDL